MNFVWPKERSMQSEFTWLRLTAATVQHDVRAMCPGPGSCGPWSPSVTDKSPALLLLSTMAGDASVLGSENASLDTLFRRLIAMEQIINDVGQPVSTSMVELDTTQRHSGLPNWPTLQGRDCVPPHPTCSANHGTRCPRFAGQWCHSTQSSGHHRFLAACSPDLASINFWTMSN